MIIKFEQTEKKLARSDLDKFQKKFNFMIPEEYQQHIMKYNGGRCYPNVIDLKVNNKTIDTTDVDWFLALYDGEYDSLENYFINYKIDNELLPDSWFPIAHDSGGNLFCMDTQTNRIYFWDHELEPLSKVNKILVADNLESFFKSLHT